MAEPQGGRVVGGAGTIHEGKDTVVEQSSRDLVVDWKRFDVGKNESVHFRQESAGHSVLNRIYDSKPSEIWGRITARGRVWLLNPNGVFFGRGARVSVGSLVASGLWMEKEDFLAGRYVLSRRGETAGTVRNAGVLEASSGGIGLAGGSAVNEGEIRARAGRVTLAGGERMVVDFDGDGLLGFTLAEGTADSAVRNEGTLEGGSVSLGLRQASGVFDGVVNNEGVVRALGIEERGGVAVLVGSEVNHTGRIAAQGGSQEGHGPADASQADASQADASQADTSQADASQADTSQAGVSQAGSADSVAATGGTVELQGARISHGGAIEVSGATGGMALLEALDTLEVSGSTLARGVMGAGGDIRLLAERVNVRAGAQADASGATDGGAVRVGGGWQGLERGIRNARETMVEQDVSLRADGGVGAGGRGDGGTVVVWADGTTRFAGRISARGGALGGNGGQAEVSGREHLYMRGLADLRAPQGRTGTLLLDPGRVDLCHEGNEGCDTSTMKPGDPSPKDRLSDEQLATMLVSADVTIRTSEATTRMTPVEATFEDIVVTSNDFDLSWTTDHVLKLVAGRDILLDGNINGGAVGTLDLSFGRNLNFGKTSLAAVAVVAAGTAAGTQTITGSTDGSTWAVTADGAGTLTVGMQDVSFSGVENLQGDAGVDTFTVNGAHTGDLMGGGGTDVFNIGAALTGSLSGEGGADAFNLNTGGSVSASVSGGMGSDTFDFNGGAVSGTVAGGGSDTDLLDFADAAVAVSVTLSGEPDADGYGGGVTGGATVSFTGIGDIRGSMSASSDRLTGRDAAASWVVGAAPTYESDDSSSPPVTRKLAFDNIEELQGGSMADTFEVSGAYKGNLMGGGGADVFNLNAALMGMADGEAGADTFILGASGSASDGLNGGAGADMDTLAGQDADATWTVGATSIGYEVGGTIQTLPVLGNIEVLRGGSMADTFTVSGARSFSLEGGGGADVFNIGAALTGSLSGEGGADAFNLNTGGSVSGGVSGGMGADTFDFNGGTVSGTVAGGADADVLDFAGLTTAVTVTLSGDPDTAGYGGSVAGAATVSLFAGIQSLVGGTGTDVLSGLASGTWKLGASDSYESGGETLSFSAIENLQGGSMADTFTVSGAHTGNLMGGGGADEFHLNAALAGAANGEAGADTFTLGASGSASGGLDGGADTDTLAGRDADVTWTVGATSIGYDAGGTMQTLPALSNIEVLRGGSMADTFTVSGARSFSLEGGGGADVFNVGAALTGSLSGEGGADAFNLNTGGSVSGGVSGGMGADTFAFNGGTVSGTVAGGADADVLDFAGLAAAVSVALSGVPNAAGFSGGVTGGATVGAFTGIGEIRGSTSATTDHITGLGTGGMFQGSATNPTGYAFGMHTLMLSNFESTLASTMALLDLSAQTENLLVLLIDAGAGGYSGRWSVQGAVTTTNFMNIQEIRGGMGTGDRLTGRDADAAWTLAATNGIYASADSGSMMRTLSFSGFEDLRGGSMADSFTVSAPYVGALHGLGGADSFTLSAALTGALRGGAGVDRFTLNSGGSVSAGIFGGADGDQVSLNMGGSVSGGIAGEGGADTFDFNGGTVTGTVAGGADADVLDFADLTTAVSVVLSREPDVDGYGGDVTGGATASFTGIGDIRGSTSASPDRLKGRDVAATWTVGSMASYASADSGSTMRTLVFGAIEDLQGGSIADTFTVSVAHTGDLIGGAGADVFNLEAALTGAANGDAGDDTFTLGASGSASDGLDGGANNDMLRGRDAAATWTLNSGSDSYVVAGVDGLTQSFSNIEGLQGGSMADTFTVSGAHMGDLMGGAGADIFNIGAALTGSLMGEGGADTFNLNTGGSVSGSIQGGGDGDIFNLNAAYVNLLEGGSGADAFNLGASGSTSGGLDGGADTDTLAGRNAAATWTLDSGDTYASGSLTQTFRNIEDLQGGSMADTFEVSGTHTGNLMGGNGADMFNIGAALTGSLSGEGGADTFNLNTGGSVNMGITGGMGVDTFDFNGGTVTGTVAGGAAADVLDFATLTTAVSVTLNREPDADGYGGGVTGGATVGDFTGIGEIRGSVATSPDRLTGRDAEATWTVGSTASYASADSGSTMRTLAFGAIEDLQGGSMADTFAVSVMHTGDLMGGGGADEFNIGAALAGSLSGEGGADTFNLNTGGSVNMGITGGMGVDTFAFNGGTVTGTVAGGAGADVLDFATLTTAVSVTLNREPDADGYGGGVTGGATVGDFTGIGALRGSGATSPDRLTGRDVAATWTVGATASYASADSGSTMRTLAFSAIEDLQGGSMADTFEVSGTHTGDLMGGGGADEFNIGAALAGSLSGEGGADTFNLNTGGSVNMGITGGMGVDTFAFNGGTVTGTVAGGAGADVLDFATLTTAVSVTLNREPDADGYGGGVTGGATVGDFTGIGALRGSGATLSDRLTGRDVAATWTVGAMASYASADSGSMMRTLAFGAIEDLQGGSMADTFEVSGAYTGNLMGGGGADEFNIGAALAGSLSGEGGADTFNLNTGGSVNMGITGGMGVDTFAFNGGTVMGTVAGGAAADVLDFATLTTAVSVTLSGEPDADGYGGGVTGGATVGTFTGIDELRGSGATLSDRLTGRDVAATWTVGTTASYASADSGSTMRTLAFGAIEDLQGGSMADTFAVSGTYTGNLMGGGGSDEFNIGAALAGSLSGEGGADTFNLNMGGSVSGAIQGGDDGDIFNLNAAYASTLEGGGGSDAFNLNAALTGAANGDADADTFTLGASGSASGGLDGGADTDTLAGRNAAATWTLDSGDTYASGSLTQTFRNIEDLQGGSMADTFEVSGTHTGNLMGGNGADMFNIGAALTGSLSGEGGADTFNLNTGGSVNMGITGGMGVDTFDFNGGTVMGTVAGGAAADVLDFATLTTAVSVTLSGEPDADGYGGGVTGGATVGDFTGIGALRGSGATLSDRLTGRDVAATWTVGTTASYASADSGSTMRTLAFGAIEDLQGGSMADTFEVSGAHTGDLMGGAGADTFNLNTGGSVSGAIRGGDDGDIFNLNAAYASTLEGGGGADAFNLEAALTGAANGDAGDDTFTLGASGSASGGLDGGANTDMLTGRNAAATWTLATGNYASGSLTQSFSNIEDLQGGSMADTFAVSVAHTGDLMGGGGADEFNIGAALTGSLSGEGGADTFNLNTGGSVNMGITGGMGVDTFDFNGGTVTGTVAGGAAADVLDFATLTTAVSVTLNREPDADGYGGGVTGGATVGDFTGIGEIRGSVATSPDRLTGRDAEATWTVGATASYASADSGSTMRTLAFGAIEDLQGGSMADTFAVSVAHTGDLMGGGGADMFNIGAALTGSLSGEGGADTFNLNMGGSVNMGITGGMGVDTFDFNGGTVTGTVAGGAAADVLDFATLMTAVSVTLSAEPDADGYGGGVTGGATVGTFTGIGALRGSGATSPDRLTGRDVAATWTVGTTASYASADSGSTMRTLAFGAIEELQGGSMADTFAVSGAYTGDLMGGGGADEFNIGAALIGSLLGEGGTDVFNLNTGGSVSGAIQGGDDGDIFNLNTAYMNTLEGGGGADEFNLNAALTGVANGDAGDDTFRLGMSGSASGGLDGGANTDTLMGRNVAATWTLDSGNTYASGSLTQSFSNIEDLQGGSMVDTFEVNGAHTGDLMGGAGADAFNLNAALTGAANGDAGADTFTLGASGSASGGLDGGTETDRLTGRDADATWTLDSGNTYASGSLTQSFSNIEDLQGGSMADAFRANAAHTGDLSGGEGNDRFTLNAVLTGDAKGEGGNDQFQLGAMGGANVLEGAAGTDRLTGRNADATWTLGSGSNSYVVPGMNALTQSFSGIETLTGGTMTDIFDFNGGSAEQVFGGSGASVDVLDFATLTTAVAVSLDLTPFPTFEGYTGSVTGGATLDFREIGDIRGSMTAATDRLTGRDPTATWTLGMTNRYATTDSMFYGGTVQPTLVFSNFEALVGGSGVDTFEVSAVHTGSLSGGGGADVFELDGGGGVMGALNGDAGDDVLDFATLTTAVSVTLSGTPDADGYGGSVAGGATVSAFTGISELHGSAATSPDRLTGRDAAATWTVGTTASYASADSGSTMRTLAFDNIEDLQGGSMADTFTVSGAHTGDLLGGAGADVFIIGASLTGGLSGEGDGDIFRLNAGGSVSLGIMGGMGLDTFDFNGGTVTGTVDGNAGADVLDFADLTTAVSVTLSGTPDSEGFDGSVAGAATVSFENVRTLVGGSDDEDRLSGLNAASTWTLGSSDSYASGGETLSFSAIEDLQSGSGSNTYTVSDAHTGDLMGGAGADVFIIGAALTGSLSGEGDGDIFRLNAGGSVSLGIMGGMGLDTFDFNGGTVTGTVDGNAGADVLDFADLTTAVSVSLSDTPDSEGFDGSVAGAATVSFENVRTLVGGGDDEDRLSGLNADSAWTLGSSDSYASGGETLGFSAIEDLQGGSGVDTFDVGGAHTGDLMGGAGADVFIIGAALTGSLSGEGDSDIFRLNTGGSVSLGIMGGMGLDTFDFNGGTVTGTVDGNAGADVLDFADLTTAVSVSLSGTPDSEGFDGSVAGGATVSFENVRTLVGGSDDEDRLSGLNADSAWTLGSSDTYASGGETLSFSAIEDLQSGSGSNTYTVSDAHTGDLMGGAGADVFIIGAALTGGLSGEGDGDTFRLNAGGSVSLGIMGGMGLDTFDFNGGTVTGTVDGNAGADVLDFADLTTAVSVSLSGTPDSEGFDGSVAGAATVSFENVRTLVGGSDDEDRLSGLNAASTWTLGSSDSYASGGETLSFSAIEDLQSGSASNTYTVSDAHTGDLLGGAGADVFIIGAALTGSLSGEGDGDTFRLNTGGSVSLGIMGGMGLDTFDFNGGTVTGTVDGNAGADVLDFADLTTAVSVSLSGTPDSEGFDGSVEGAATVSFANVRTLVGGGDDEDRLSGLNAASTWALGSSDSYASGGETLGFSAIEDLQGGSGVDTFDVGGAHTGDLLGGGGADVFTIAASLTGSLSGEGDGDIFRLNAGGSVSLGIMGGMGLDTFDFNGGTVTGTVDGNAGADVLDFADLTTAVSVELSDTPDSEGFDGSVEGGVTVSFANVRTLVGGSDDEDRLSGLDADSTWALGSSDSYASGGETLSFSAIEDLQSGSGSNTYTVSDAHTGDLMGGAGADVFIIGAALTGGLSGEGDGDTFRLNAGGSVSLGIMGGMGLDTFDFNGGTVTGTVDGNAGADVLDFADLTTAVSVSLSGTPDSEGFDGSVAGAATVSFENVRTLVGGGDDEDRLSGLNAASTWALGSSDSYASGGETLGFSAIEDLQGGSGADAYTVSDAHTGDLMGGGGADEFTIAASLTGGLSGEGDGDIFRLNAGGSVSLSIMGGMGLDTFDFNGGTVTGTVDGNAGADVLDFADLTTAVSVSLSGTPDSEGFDGSVAGAATVSFENVRTLVGGGDDEDRLSGLNADSAWTLGSSDTYASGGETLSFSAIEDLQGGSGVDTFDVGGAHTGDLLGGGGADVFTIAASLTGGLSGEGDGDIFRLNTGGSVSLGIMGGMGLDTFDFNGGTVTGTVDGNAGADVLDFADLTTAVSVELSGTPDSEGFDGSVAGAATVSFENVRTLVGGSDDEDRLSGLDADSTWALGSSDSYASGGETLGFSAIEDLQGGSGADTFDVGGAHTGDLMGGAGADVFIIGAALTGGLSGEGDGDIFRLNTGGSVSLGIMGGMGLDTFDFNGGTVTGTVDGNAGADVLDFADLTTAVSVSLSGTPDSEGFDGSVAGAATVSFENVRTLVGGSDDGDRLSGLNAASTWTLGSSDSYASGGETLGFSAIEDLQGGSGADAFTVSDAHTGDLMGGGGADVFTIAASLTGGLSGEGDGDIFRLNAGGSVSLGIMGGMGLDTFDFNGGTVTGTVDGNAGADVLDFADLTTAVSVELSGTPDSEGFDGSVAGAATVSFENVRTLVGGSDDEDRLSGLNADSTWTLGSSDSYASGGETLSFSAIEDLQGGSGVDTFDVGGAHTGDLLGGAGADVFTIAASLTGGLSGEGDGDIFRLNTGGSVSLGIMGGMGLDTFDFNGGTVTGTVDGNAGADVLDFADLTTAVSVELSGTPDSEGFDGSVAGGATVSFENVRTLVGGGDDEDRLSGLNAASTWTLGSSDTYASGGETLGFSAIEDLQGGSGVDTFDVGGAHTGDLLGGAGADVFTIAAALTGGLSGEGDGDIFRLNAGGSVSLGIMGGMGLDTFDFNGGTVTGTVDGNAGADVLDFADLTTAVSVSLSGTPDSEGFDGSVAGGATVSFANVRTLVGSGHEEDGLSGLDAASTWTLGSSDSYASGGETLGFSAIEDLQGGSGADAFTVSDAHTGDLLGGGGADVFTIAAALTGSLSGEGDGDTFRLNAGGSVSLDVTGGSGGDTFRFDGGIVAGAVDGGTGADTLDVSPLVGPVTIYMDQTGGCVRTSGCVLLRTDSPLTPAAPMIEALVATYASIESLQGGVAAPAAGAYLVVLPVSVGEELVINPVLVDPPVTGMTRIQLPDLQAFPGPVFIGGTWSPPLAFPGETDPQTPPLAVRDAVGNPADPSIDAARVTVAGEVSVPGTLVLLAGDVVLEADIAAGASAPDDLESAAGSEQEAILVAVNDKVGSLGGSGDIEASGGERRLYAGSAALIADRGVVNSRQLVVDLAGGDLQFAVSAGAFSSSTPSLLSRARGINLGSFLQQYITDLGLAAVGFLVTFNNPASNLTQTEEITSIDLALLEEELALFSAIGQGLALSLAQCEELEGCAPNIDETQLDDLIKALEAKVQELQDYLLGPVAGEEREKATMLLKEYQAQLEDFLNYRQEFRALFAEEDVEDGEGLDEDGLPEEDFSFDEGSEEALSEEEPPLDQEESLPVEPALPVPGGPGGAGALDELLDEIPSVAPPLLPSILQ